MSMVMERVGAAPNDEVEMVARAILRPTAPFDFKQSLNFMRNSGANDLNDSFGPEDNWLERPVSLDGQPFLVRLTNNTEDVQTPSLQLSVRASDDSDQLPDAKVIEAAAEWANRRFFLDVDMEAVREVLAVNDYGESLVGKFWPSRPVNLPGAWEGLLKTVVSVQIYPGLAQRLQRGLLDLYGEAVRFRGQSYHLFPTAAKLAAIGPDELLTMKFSRQKASYLPGIAQMVLAEPQKYDWEAVRQLSGEAAVAVLDDLPGVGAWTASYCAMRALPHLDVITKEEGLRKALANAYDRRAVISPAETEQLMAVFAPYRTFACYYTYMLMYNA